MTVGELSRAKRRALNILDTWLEVTGAIDRGSGWHDELESIVEDAVEIGAQHCSGEIKPLEVERKD